MALGGRPGHAGSRAHVRREIRPRRWRVVDVPGVSMELCGGTAQWPNTRRDGPCFKISGEKARGRRHRRIEAVAGPALLP